MVLLILSMALQTLRSCCGGDRKSCSGLMESLYFEAMSVEGDSFLCEAVAEMLAWILPPFSLHALPGLSALRRIRMRPSEGFLRSFGKGSKSAEKEPDPIPTLASKRFQ